MTTRLAPALALLLAACASVHEPGWHGEGAEPFDAAEAACRERSAAMSDATARDAEFVTCMAHRGWHRAPPR